MNQVIEAALVIGGPSCLLIIVMAVVQFRDFVKEYMALRPLKTEGGSRRHRKCLANIEILEKELQVGSYNPLIGDKADNALAEKLKNLGADDLVALIAKPAHPSYRHH